MDGQENPGRRTEDLVDRARRIRAAAGLDRDVRRTEAPPAEAYDGAHTIHARRAFRNAVLGIFFLPGVMSALAVPHLREYWQTPGRPSARARLLTLAAVVLIPFGFLTAVAAVLWVIEIAIGRVQGAGPVGRPGP
jgi:hypothetical protein